MDFFTILKGPVEQENNQQRKREKHNKFKT